MGEVLADRYSQYGARVIVIEPDVMKCIEAAEKGFTTFRTLEEAVKYDKPFLIVGASGYNSISKEVIEQLEDGTFVTHGQNPETTEMNMKENGEEYSTYTNEKGTVIESNVYSVRLNENDKILDMITEKDLKRTIPGDNYLEMKDYNSILEKMGNVVSKSYSLMNVVGAENISQATVDNYKKELLKAVKKYQIDNIVQTQDTTQQDVQKDDGMEIDD